MRAAAHPPPSSLTTIPLLCPAPPADCCVPYVRAARSGRKRDETYLHLVMDFLPDTIRSVALQFQKERTRFPSDHVRAYLYQTLKALEYVHSKRICHRDLKPDNLLVDASTLKLKLIDFGCAKVLVKGQPNVSYICSRYYRAPELMFGATEYTCAVDMWSIGTIMVELLLGHLPFQGQDSTQQHLVEIMKLLGTPTDKELRAMRATCSVDELPKLKAYPWERVFPAGTPARAMDLARKLLCYDPTQRLTATQALTHPFLQDVQYLLGENGVQSSPQHDIVKAFQQELHTKFQAALQVRDAELDAKALEAQLSAAIVGMHLPTEEVKTTVMTELANFLRDADKRCVDKLRAIVEETLKGAGQKGAGAEGGGGGSNGKAASSSSTPDAQTARLQQQVADEQRAVALLREQAEAARKESEGLRQQLAAMQAQLEANNQNGADAADDGRAQPPSAGRRATKSDAAGGVAPSPMVGGAQAQTPGGQPKFADSARACPHMPAPAHTIHMTRTRTHPRPPRRAPFPSHAHSRTHTHTPPPPALPPCTHPPRPVVCSLRPRS